MELPLPSTGLLGETHPSGSSEVFHCYFHVGNVMTVPPFAFCYIGCENGNLGCFVGSLPIAVCVLENTLYFFTYPFYLQIKVRLQYLFLNILVKSTNAFKQHNICKTPLFIIVTHSLSEWLSFV